MTTPKNENEFNRRDFLKGGSAATLMTFLGGVPLLAQTATNSTSESAPAGPKLKCALIGLGFWGREILATLGRVPEIEVAAICDTYPPSLRRSAMHAPGAAQTADYPTILSNPDIRAVIVATPTHLHKDIVLAALKAGKHVYCEAPLANSVEDAREIALAAKGAVKQVFQAGLQRRSDPQRSFLLPFIRSGALGKAAFARAQWHKKQSWRFTSPNPEHEKALNWRLHKATSSGLIGEIGIHQLDAAGWFLDAQPVSAIGYGSIILWNDGRDVPDTVQAIIEYPDGVRMIYDSTLVDSFDSEYEVYYGSYAAIMLRESNAWMFKEVDSPLLGWEVYARKDKFYEETGIALVANATKLSAQGDKPAADKPTNSPLFYALQSFAGNCAEVSAGVQDFSSMFDPNDKAALAKYLATIKLRPAAGYAEGYTATVLGIKTNEAVMKGERIVFQKEWFELA